MERVLYDVVVIGGGPAGMAAALASNKEGASTLIIERDSRLGGILNQCIHQGFGIHYFNEEMTGPEYAARFQQMVEKEKIDVYLESMVLSLTKEKIVTVLTPDKGIIEIKAKSIVLAMGCRERTAGAIQLPGSRPSGIYTAGMAQKICNIDGYLVGKEIVILGSGDIGLIMARRMTLEGANVKLVLELMPYSSGLKRNIVQCLNDFNIPIKYSHAITKVVGKERLKGVYYAPVDENKKPIRSKEEFVSCDTLLLSVGLIPENDLLNDLKIDMSKITSGAIVDDKRMTSIDGIFSCGNVLHVHDLVDNVSNEAEIAGQSAAKFAKNELDLSHNKISVKAIEGIKYALPQLINKSQNDVTIYFRVDDIYKNKKLILESKGKILKSKKYLVLSPGEMEKININANDLESELILRLE